MDKVSHPTAGPDRRFVDGTVVTAETLDSLQEEIVNAIKAAGLTPNSADLTQLTQAIRALGGGAQLGGSGSGGKITSADVADVNEIVRQATITRDMLSAEAKQDFDDAVAAARQATGEAEAARSFAKLLFDDSKAAEANIAGIYSNVVALNAAAERARQSAESSAFEARTYEAQTAALYSGIAGDEGGFITEIRQDILDLVATDAAFAESITTVNGTLADQSAALAAEVSNRETAIANETGARTSAINTAKSEVFGAAASSFSGISTVLATKVDADGAATIADQRISAKTTAGPIRDALNATVAELTLAYTNADEALGSRIEVVESQYVTILAGIDALEGDFGDVSAVVEARVAAETTARTTAIAAETASRTALAGRVTTQETLSTALAADTVGTLATRGYAFAVNLRDLNTRVDGASANISALQTTKVDSAGAQSISESRISAALAPGGSIRGQIASQIGAENLSTMRADITGLQTSKVTAAGAEAIAETRISAQLVDGGTIDNRIDALIGGQNLGQIRADITNINATKVDSAGANAVAGTRITAEIQPGGAIDNLVDSLIAAENLTAVRADISTIKTTKVDAAGAQAVAATEISARMGDIAPGYVDPTLALWGQAGRVSADRWAAQGAVAVLPADVTAGKKLAFSVSAAQADGLSAYAPRGFGGTNQWRGPAPEEAVAIELWWDQAGGSIASNFLYAAWTNTAGQGWSAWIDVASARIGASGGPSLSRVILKRPPGFTGQLQYFVAHLLLNWGAVGGPGTPTAQTFYVHRFDVRNATPEELGKGEIAAKYDNLIATKVDAAGARAAVDFSVSAQAGGRFAGVTGLTNALATLDGQARALNYLAVQADGWVGSEALGAGPNGSFKAFSVDTFVIGRPGQAASFPFRVEGGVVYMNEAYIKALSVDTLKLAGEAVTTEKLGGNAASDGYTASGTTGTTGFTIVLPRRSKVLFLLEFSGPSGPGSVGDSGIIPAFGPTRRILVNGATILNGASLSSTGFASTMLVYEAGTYVVTVNAVANALSYKLHAITLKA